MKILGIDYGKAKVGLAIGLNDLAEPLKVVRYSSIENLIEQIKEVIDLEKIEKVVVGISEGKMGKESKAFSITLGKELSISVETFDETLTSQDAQRLAREGGVSQKKRKNMEDAYAATLILQNYLEKYPVI